MLYCFLLLFSLLFIFSFFFFNDTATTEIYTLSLHDALPISLLDFFHFTAAFVGRLLQCGHHLGDFFLRSGRSADEDQVIYAFFHAPSIPCLERVESAKPQWRCFAEFCGSFVPTVLVGNPSPVGLGPTATFKGAPGRERPSKSNPLKSKSRQAAARAG